MQVRYLFMAIEKNDQYSDLLHSVGLKATDDRKRILQILERYKKPVSVQDIHKKARRSDIATVYRALDVFKKKGIVRQVNLSDQRRFFEIATSSHHHHIVCKKCGFVEKIDECVVKDVLLRQLKTCRKFAKITDHTFEIFGVCKKCAKF